MAQEDYTHPEYLVEPGWLAEHLDDANVVVVDCDVDAAYNRAHVPGAVAVPDNFEKDPDTGRIHLMNPEQFQSMCQRLGIGGDTLVIGYDNSQSLYAARLWWALNTYGHRNVKVLNGGWRAWIAGGHGVGLERPGPAQGVTFTPSRDESLLVKADELKDAFLVNPFATDRFARTIDAALKTPYTERQRRMKRMRSVVKENNIYKWAADLITEMAEFENQPIRVG